MKINTKVGKRNGVRIIYSMLCFIRTCVIQQIFVIMNIFLCNAKVQYFLLRLYIEEYYA